MFFEPSPAAGKAVPRGLPELPSWSGPPAEETGAVPFGGIELTITELDGAAIVAAAERSARYWPETG